MASAVKRLVNVMNAKDLNKSPPADHPVHALPPKPVPFASSPRHDESREELRKELHKRRQSLTPQEHVFLEQLVVHGNEIEVNLAKKKLCDENLFFEINLPDWRQDVDEELLEGDDGEERQRSASLSALESGRSHSLSAIPFKRSWGSNTSTRSVSEKSLEHLEARLKNDLHGQMWKAHEQGMLLSTKPKSLAHRRRSKSDLVRRSSFLSDATQELLLEGGPKNRPGEEEIFRNDEAQVKKGKLDRKGAISSVGNSHGRSVSWGRGSFRKEGSLPPRRPTLMRMRSEGSRKLVSFKKDDEGYGIPPRITGADRRFSIESELSELGAETPFSSTSSLASVADQLPPIRSESPLSFPPPLKQGRSDSVSSIPSIRHARPVRSNSISSIPSGRPALHGRSNSVSSIPSIHHAHPIRSDSISSIPSLHHAHPIRSDSVLSNFSRPGSPWSLASDVSARREEAAWTAPLPAKIDLSKSKKEKLLRDPVQELAPLKRPVLFRNASRNTYNGEGIEVSEVSSATASEYQIDTLSNARNFGSMVSLGDASSIPTSSSYDENWGRATEIFRDLGTVLSDENLSDVFLGNAKSLFRESITSLNVCSDEDRDHGSWDMNDSDVDFGQYNTWNVLKKEEPDGYGGGGTLPFLILGTSGDDEGATPHVLSPPLMESLQGFLPYGICEDNFWMKFSLLRDGASMHTMLQQIRGARYTIIALETWDGEVFGSFTSEPWRKNWNYFGTGEAFLWRMRKPRKSFCSSMLEQAQLESELDVYPWTGDNQCIQLCTNDKLAVGGGETSPEGKQAGGEDVKPEEFGFGLTVDSELLFGTSTRCATFGSPPLSVEHPDGSAFEIVNLEVWTLTPCSTLEEAEKLELGRLFLESS